MATLAKSLTVGIIFLMKLVLPASAITWRFVDVAVLTNTSGSGQFDARISGTFDYDSDTNFMSNINITVVSTGLEGTPSRNLYDGQYTQEILPSFNNIFDIARDGDALADGAFVIQLKFATPLLNTTSPGEKVFLSKASVGFCETFDINSGCNTVDEGGFGTNELTNQGNQTLVGAVTPVPLPAALPLMIAGLAGLGFAARRRRATA